MTPPVPPPLPEPEAQTRWYYADVFNLPIGPISFDQLESFARTGKIKTSTLVLREGEEEWQYFSSVSSTAFDPRVSETPKSREEVTGENAEDSADSFPSVDSAKSKWLQTASKFFFSNLGPIGAVVAAIASLLFLGLVVYLASNAPARTVNPQEQLHYVQSGKPPMSKADAAVALRDVEDLAADLESLLSNFQNGQPATVELIGRVNRWKSEVRSTESMMDTREIRTFAASGAFVKALDNMKQAWASFERAARARDGFQLGDAANSHENELRMMRENIEDAKSWMSEGKY